MAYFRKRENKTWEYRISYKDVNGKNKIKSKSGFRTKSEANQAAIEAEKALNQNTLSASIAFIPAINIIILSAGNLNTSSFVIKSLARKFSEVFLLKNPLFV